jgi:pimeloyl-ACP methyl ester carboxylesterase
LPAPDANLAVAVAGIGSKTAGGVNADLYEYGPEELGYPHDRVFRFSYRGINGPHLHEPYRRTDTYRDLRLAARRLGHLLAALGKRFPGKDVDLFAHSQGGVVARLFLESQRAAWDARFPRIDHFVTFSTPNQGAPLAQVANDLGSTEAGRPLLRAVSRWSQTGGPVPDPMSPAVTQLAPDSALQGQLARQDVSYGTQVLSLATPLDLMVPADRAALPGKLNRIVPPNGIWAHSAIVRSETARRIEYSFLRGGPVACRTWWDRHGSAIGRGIDWVESHLGGPLSSMLRVAGTPIRWAREFASKL